MEALVNRYVVSGYLSKHYVLKAWMVVKFAKCSRKERIYSKREKLALRCCALSNGIYWLFKFT